MDLNGCYISLFSLSFLTEALLALPAHVAGLLGTALLQLEATLPEQQKKKQERKKKEEKKQIYTEKENVKEENEEVKEETNI